VANDQGRQHQGGVRRAGGLISALLGRPPASQHLTPTKPRISRRFQPVKMP
jgi:hypothetical protein